ncbi:MAG: hypothetical protein AAF202_04265, partial [Pseudomonadota bacterium]
MSEKHIFKCLNLLTCSSLLLCGLNAFAVTDDYLYSPLPPVCELTLKNLSPNHGGFGLSNLPTDYEAPKREDYAYGGGSRYSQNVKDQCQYGGCWASAVLQIPENVAHKQGVDLTLSTE